MAAGAVTQAARQGGYRVLGHTGRGVDCQGRVPVRRGGGSCNTGDGCFVRGQALQARYHLGVTAANTGATQLRLWAKINTARTRTNRTLAALPGTRGKLVPQWNVHSKTARKSAAGMSAMWYLG